MFTVKHRSDGLVAKKGTHRPMTDYEETIALVAKMNSIRVLISLATNQGWPLLQFDMKNAFLHGNLDEEVYMKPPLRFVYSTTKRKVCKLKKALYGLKQSHQTWFE